MKIQILQCHIYKYLLIIINFKLLEIKLVLIIIVQLLSCLIIRRIFYLTTLYTRICHRSLISSYLYRVCGAIVKRSFFVPRHYNYYNYN